MLIDTARNSDDFVVATVGEALLVLRHTRPPSKTS